MVYLKKKEVTKDKVTYYYQPEKKGEFGIITFTPTGKEIFIVEKVAESSGYYSYLLHAYTQLYEFYQSDNYPEEKLVKWG